MTIQIITSSYPASPGDPTAAAGLFVRYFGLELVKLGHKVIVLTAGRSKQYEADTGIIVERIPWLGGDGELASISFLNPVNWFIILHFLWSGCREATRYSTKYHVERNLCMWIVPSGIFGRWVNRKKRIPYDVWALGSDIWKVRKVPFGRMILRSLAHHAADAYADGVELKRDAESITGKSFEFLATSRILPKADVDLTPLQPPGLKHFLFVGRYHKNKGPDLLVEAIGMLSPADRKKLKVYLFGYGVLEGTLDGMIRNAGLEELVVRNKTISETELSGYLARCDYLVIPSRVESIPVVLSDAVLNGVPLIVSDAGDMGSLVQSNKAGFVFSRGDASSLAEKLRLALEVDRSEFGSGVKILAQMFDIRQSCATWLKNASAASTS